MSVQKNNCSSSEHEEIDANIYCFECKLHFCNKCEIFHSKIFKNHQTCNIKNLNKDIEDIFTGICKEKEHYNKLEFFLQIS